MIWMVFSLVIRVVVDVMKIIQIEIILWLVVPLLQDDREGLVHRLSGVASGCFRICIK